MMHIDDFMKNEQGMVIKMWTPYKGSKLQTKTKSYEVE